MKTILREQIELITTDFRMYCHDVPGHPDQMQTIDKLNQSIKDYCLELVGDDEKIMNPSKAWREPAHEQNNLRQELRRKIEEDFK